MDLIVNGPVKAGIRRARCEALYDFFQSWKVKRLQAQVNKMPLPKFQPPKPKVTDGLRTLLKVCDETFATDAFQARNITKQLPLHPLPSSLSPSAPGPLLALPPLLPDPLSRCAYAGVNEAVLRQCGAGQG